jgi:hypothetical protein
LASLASHPFLGWKIIIDNPKDDNELASLIKQNFGSSCIINNMNLQKSGIKELTIKGSDWKDSGDYGNCYLDFAYKILYSPEKHKLMSVILGQECTFGTDPSSPSYKCYDNEIIKSFQFN